MGFAPVHRLNGVCAGGVLIKVLLGEDGSAQPVDLAQLKPAKGSQCAAQHQQDDQYNEQDPQGTGFLPLPRPSAPWGVGIGIRWGTSAAVAAAAAITILGGTGRTGAGALPPLGDILRTPPAVGGLGTIFWATALLRTTGARLLGLRFRRPQPLRGTGCLGSGCPTAFGVDLFFGF